MGILARMFWKNFNEAAAAIQAKIIALDPKTATAAQLDEFGTQLNALSIQLAEANVVLEREKKEAELARANYNKKVSAAEILQEQITNETDAAKKASLTTSFERLVKELEEMFDDVEREEQEAVDAAAVSEQLREATEQMADVLKKARGQLKRAQSDLKRAESAAESAKQREDAAKMMAGINDESSKVNEVLAALQKQTTKAQVATSAANTRAELLKPDTSGDVNIEAAMRQVEGQPPAGDLSARLAALKKK